jgi:hypothetical protein
MTRKSQDTAQGRNIRTILVVFYIPGMVRNLIYVSKMSDVGVYIVFQNKTCKMVRGVMALMRGVRNGTLYNLLGSTISNGCNNFVVCEGEEDKTLMVSREKTMLWHQRL